MDELGPIEEGVDWRGRVTPEMRLGNANDILMTLQKALPTTPTTLIDLQKVAARLEGRMYTVAIDYGDYLRRICLRRNDLGTKLVSCLVLQQLFHQQTLRAQELCRLSDPVQSNNFLCVQQQPSIPSPCMLQQQNKSDKQGQIIQAEGDIQGTSSSSMLSDKVPLSTHKEPCGKDRLSELPDDLIHIIMSSLPAQEAARTSVLSHKWLNRWALAPFIEIDIDWFHKDREQFSKFVDRLLLLRDRDDASMKTFQLHSFAIDRASSWIHHAIKHKVQVLKFAEYIRWEPFYLDPELVAFSSEYLRTLELTNVALDASVFDLLNNACPALENLQLIDSLLEATEISSSSLKNLDIIDCSLFKDLRICTPSLVSLCIEDRRYNDPSFRNAYLITAAVTLFDLSNVKSMDLSACVRKVTFGEEAGSCPMFDNLTSLCLGGWCRANEFLPVLRFIQHSPMLKKLTVKLDLEVWGYHSIVGLAYKLRSLHATPSLEIDVRTY